MSPSKSATSSFSGYFSVRIFGLVCLVCQPLQAAAAAASSAPTSFASVNSAALAAAVSLSAAVRTSAGQLTPSPDRSSATATSQLEQQASDADDRLKDAQLDQKIWRELNASAAAARELRRLKPAERTLARALQLCLSQEPDLFCAWFALARKPSALGIDGIYQLTCFNELQHTCNRVSSKNRGRHTQCRPACAPCRRLLVGAADLSPSASIGTVGDSGCPGCSQQCYCTCDYVRDSNSSYSTAGAIYPCSQLCSGDSKCPNEADENPANCDDYAASAPNFLFYVVVLGCIGGVAALCSLPFVLPKVRKYCCRGPSSETRDGAAAGLPRSTVTATSAAHHHHHHHHHHHRHHAKPATPAAPETAAFLPTTPKRQGGAADAAEGATADAVVSDESDGVKA